MKVDTRIVKMFDVGASFVSNSARRVRSCLRAANEPAVER